MKTYTYYIYHIPGDKIGCTTELQNRMHTQGFTEWEILWQEEGNYDHGWIAGDKELELQKEYGYRVDDCHYQVSRENRRKMTEASHTTEANAKRSNSLLGNTNGKGVKGTVFTEERKSHISKVLKGRPQPKTNCSYCDRQISLSNIKKHENFCKNKKGPTSL